MFKNILLIAVFFVITSCSTMEQNGYIRPKKLQTKNMVVSSNGFIYTHRLGKKIDMQYFIMLKFPMIDEVAGRYIVIEFQDPIKKDSFTKEILLIKKKEDTMYLKSRKMYGFKNMRSYLIKASLSDDKYGNKILENIEQYTRVEYIPYGYKNEM